MQFSDFKIQNTLRTTRITNASQGKSEREKKQGEKIREISDKAQSSIRLEMMDIR